MQTFLVFCFIIIYLNLITASSITERIPYQRLGPSIQSWVGLNYIIENYNYGLTNYTPIDSGAPVLTIGVALALSGPNELDLVVDDSVPLLLQYAVDFVNAYGGIAINNPNQNGSQINYQLSVLSADHQSSPSMMRLIYADMIDQGIELVLGPYGDVMQRSFNEFLLLIDQSINISVITAVSFEKSTYQMGVDSLFGIWGSANHNSLSVMDMLEMTIRKSQAMSSIGYTPCGNDCFDTSTEDPPDNVTVNRVVVNQPVVRFIHQSAEKQVSKLSVDQSSNKHTNDQFVVDEPNDQAINRLITSATAPTQDLIDELNAISSRVDGITSICLFAVDTFVGRLMQSAVVEWIATTNHNRSTSQPVNRPLVTLVLDQLLPPRDLLVSEYLDYWLMCPDNTNVVIMPLNLATSKSLEMSKRRFGLVIDLEVSDSIFYFPVDGWTAWTSYDPSTSATIYPIWDTQSDIMLYFYYYWIVQGIETSYFLNSGILRIAELTFIIGALNRTTGTSKSEFAAGMHALDGETSIVGLISFDSDRINVGDNFVQTYVYQKSPNNGYMFDYDASVYQWKLFPYDWPWYDKRYGDAIDSSQEAYPLLFALLVAGIGSWICFVLFEQSVFVMSSSIRRARMAEFALFQLLSALMLTAATITCAQLILAIAVRTSYGEVNELKLSLVVALRAWGLSWLPVCLAFFVLSDFYARSQRWLIVSCKQLLGLSSLVASSDQTGDRKQSVQDNQTAVQSTYWKELVHLIKIALHPRYLLAGLFIAGSVVLSRLSLFSSWRHAAYYVVLSYAWVTSLVMDTFVFSLVSTALCHSFRWRIPAVFVLAGGVIADWEIALLATSFYYDPQGISPSGTEPDTAMISAIVTATVVVIFCLLVQYLRMHGAHKHLNRIIVAKDSGVTAAKIRKQRSDDNLAHAKRMVRKMVAALQSVTLAVNPPLHFALSMALFHVHLLNSKETESSEESAMVASIHHSHFLSHARTSISEAVMSTLLHTHPVHHQSQLAEPNPHAIHQLVDQSVNRSRSPRSTHQSTAVPPPPLQPAAVPQSAAQSDSQPATQSAIYPATLTRRSSMRLRQTLSSASRVARLSGRLSSSGSIDMTLQQVQSLHPSMSVHVCHSENVVVVALEALASDVRWTQTFSHPLVGPRKPNARPVQHLTLNKVLSHPVCIEVFKQELARAYSLELLTFYLIAHKYRAIKSDLLRKLLAPRIYNTYIVAGSPEEVNLSTDQRTCTEKHIKQNEFTSDLFLDAERECFRLMEVNVFDKFVKSMNNGYVLSCWLYAVINFEDLGVKWLEFRGFEKQEKVPP